MSRKNLPQNCESLPWTRRDAILATARGLKQLGDEQLQRIVDSKDPFLLDGMIASHPFGLPPSY